MIRYTIHRKGTCRSLAEVPKDAEIDSVNGRVCYGLCEIFGRPILDGQKVTCNSEGVWWHEPKYPHRPRDGYSTSMGKPAKVKP